jgi:arylsulfatase A-like enzyme/thioredoxin-like negative regulator of GroEL
VAVRSQALLIALSVGLVFFGCKKSKEPAVPLSRPNVVVITVDTLRADRLGCYGFEAARTPHIDRLSAEGVRVEHAIAATPTTLPSHSTIFTGLYPPAHGVRDNGRYRLPDEVETLAERFKSAGYRTQAFVSAMVLHRRYNLSQGFDGYDDELHREGEPVMFMIQERSGERTTDRVLKWLETALAPPKDRPPFFLWVHLFDPHQPYAPPEVDAKASPTLYDGEIASADRQVGRLLGELRKRGVLNDTIVAFTSDHGESLGEHGEATHALFIYESTVRVPLIFRYPRELPARKTYEGSVRSVDVMPTILGLAKLPLNDTQGVDLSAALAGAAEAPSLAPYSESLHGQLEFAMAPLFGIRSDEWSYIRAPRAELYNRAQDPAETENLLEARKSQAGKLDELVAEVLEDSKRFGLVAAANPLDDETAAMLKALGYMAESDAPAGLEGMDPKDGVRAFDEIDRARVLAHKGDYAGAKKVLEALLEWVPKNASVRNLLALCEFRMNNPDAAKQLYLESLMHEPRQPEVLRQLGRIELADRNAPAARERFLQSLKVDPADVEAMILVAHLDLRDGRLEEAKRWYERAIETDPSYPDAYLQYGDFYFRQRDFEQAKRWYDKALEAQPESFAAVLQAGTSALRLGDPVAAERYFQRANQIVPSSWKPLYNLACVQMRQGDPESAVTYLRKAVAGGFSDSALLQRDPCFAALHTDPRFVALIGR